jgi:hypothetical protein
MLLTNNIKAATYSALGAYYVMLFVSMSTLKIQAGAVNKSANRTGVDLKMETLHEHSYCAYIALLYKVNA